LLKISSLNFYFWNLKKNIAFNSCYVAVRGVPKIFYEVPFLSCSHGFILVINSGGLDPHGRGVDGKISTIHMSTLAAPWWQLSGQFDIIKSHCAAHDHYKTFLSLPKNFYLAIELNSQLNHEVFINMNISMLINKLNWILLPDNSIARVSKYPIYLLNILAL